MTAAPKLRKPTPKDEQLAYELATLRDGDTCQRCRRWCGPTARDHRKNRSQGGLTVVENLQVLGSACHSWKTEHPKDAVEEGWAVPGWADPTEFPARRWEQTRTGTLRPVWVRYLPVEAWPADWRPADTFEVVDDDELAAFGLRPRTEGVPA